MKANPLLRALALLLLLTCAAVLVVMGVGTHAMQPTAENARYTPASALLAQLHHGKALHLSSVNPNPWDEVLITHGDTLTAPEKEALLSFSPAFAFAEETESLLLFWREGQVVSLLQYPPLKQGYPYFSVENAPEGGRFYFSRENAVFMCTFVETEENGSGYYECVPMDTWNVTTGSEAV